MASSYTTSFGIEKIGSGEQSGAWGTTTNHNLDILDRIASYKAVGLSGSTHTLTVREASPESGTENLQDGMYRVVKFTGALGANNTVTVAPNTTAAYFIMINATTDSGSSGPYSVILTQGSGANITVENGKSAVVYMDGAGSGAAVIDALSNLQLATITASGDITSSGTFNALGDTAASDKAAVGYTSAEGLILTGQGSTNDVTIKNDADADVLTIATGSTSVDIVGDVTASTLNADGDTSASDNAAIGYTSAEGLILTGQGSTNDVTIKNDADADVITIATGGTNVDIVGDVTASTLNADGDTSAGDAAAIGYTSAEGLILTGQGSSYDVTIKNDADTIVAVVPTGTDDLRFLDDAKVELGSVGDLQIFHDGSNSHINEGGTGNLKISTSQLDILGGSDGGETMATFVDDGAVTLYHNNVAKIATTAAGATITGTLIATTDTDTSNTGSVTLDFTANQNFVLTFTGNVTLANPSTEQVGQSGVIVCIQDGTGSRTLSLESQYKTSGDDGITLSTGANDVDIIPYFVQAADNILLGAVQTDFVGA
jgi:hypothetical protein